MQGSGWATVTHSQRRWGESILLDKVCGKERHARMVEREPTRLGIEPVDWVVKEFLKS